MCSREEKQDSTDKICMRRKTRLTRRECSYLSNLLVLPLEGELKPNPALHLGLDLRFNSVVCEENGRKGGREAEGGRKRERERE